MGVAPRALPFTASFDGAQNCATGAPGGLERDADDARAVAAALAGNRAAEELLYRRHASTVLGLATRLLRSHQDAMDVLQDTFVCAFDELHELRDHAAFAGWIRRITVRIVHRRFRRRKLLRLLGLETRERDEGVSLSSLADARTSLEMRIELRWLDAALVHVDEQARAAWMLRHVEGLSLEETATACGCSLATIKRRIASADAVVARHFDGGQP